MIPAPRAALVLLAILAPIPAWAGGLPAQDPLYKAIAAADAALFAATNRCDLTTLDTFLADDLEFYHDKGGLSVGKDDLLQKTKENICGKMVRELVPASLEVHALPGFGAIEICTHRFLHPNEPGNIGQARFLHIWQNKNGAWTLSRVVSYDH
jgi:hypothetical protein